MISQTTFTPFLPETSGVPPTRVALVEDHAAILGMMTQVVRASPGFKIVGGAVNATEAMQIFKQETVDVLILDLMLPGVSGLTLLGELRELHPKLKVLVFSGNLGPGIMRELLAKGVLGVVEKAAPLNTFIEALHSVALGHAYFGAYASELIKGLVYKSNTGDATGLDHLSPREKSVLRYLARGLSSKEIAAELGLSLHTVVNYRSSLMKKTGLHRVAQLSLYASKFGLT